LLGNGVDLEMIEKAIKSIGNMGNMGSMGHTKKIESIHLKIDQTWHASPLAENEQITMMLDFQDEQQLSIQLIAPYFRNEPPPCPSGSTWGLWQYEVVEVFLVWENHQYLEIEMGPHGHHLVLGLDGIRQIKQAFIPVNYEAEILGNLWQGRLSLDLGKSILKESYVGVFKWQNLKAINAFAIHQPLKMRAPKEKRYCVAFAVAEQNEQANFHCIDRFVRYPR
jgi:hypothetical protein